MNKLISEDEFLHRAASVSLQPLSWSLAQHKGVEVFVRRDDLIDKSQSGNKFYKLFYNLHAARAAGFKKILSFGGAYSNHLYALAAAGRDFGFQTVGVVRGERPKQLSPTLRDVESCGMQLHFITRAAYREKMSQELLEDLKKIQGDFYIIPEGGDNPEGRRGTTVIGWALREQLKDDYTAVCLACGTGNTLSGVASGLGSNGSPKNTIGFSVLKGDGNLGRCIGANIHNAGINNWRLISGYHAGGYGKKLSPALRTFYRCFEDENSLMLDPVYTLKMFWGAGQLLQQGYWPRGSRLVFIHTGGIQGRRGFEL